MDNGAGIRIRMDIECFYVWLFIICLFVIVCMHARFLRYVGIFNSTKHQLQAH